MKSNDIKSVNESGMERRSFVLKLVAATTMGSASGLAQAQAKPVALSETDAQAVSLGYKADASKVDKAKFARYQAGQMCSNCNLFKAEANAANGACSIFPGKSVSAKGWCSAWIKKG